MTAYSSIIAGSLVFALIVAPALCFTLAEWKLKDHPRSRTVGLSANSLDGMPELPSDVVKYSQVPKHSTFTADKIPVGLLKEHTTKRGTWGIIRVDQGMLEYQVLEPEKQAFELVGPEGRGVIVPTIKHKVKPLSEDLQFVVEFYRKPGTGPVDEKREGLN